MSDPIDPAVPDELREQLNKLEVPKMVVMIDEQLKVETTHLTVKTVDEILALFTQYAREARINERENTKLPYDGDHSNCIDKMSCIGYQNAASDLYNENLIRIAELKAKEVKDE